jgi:hypothetical protein
MVKLTECNDNRVRPGDWTINSLQVVLETEDNKDAFIGQLGIDPL